MLKEVAGDILLTKAEALAHGVAPNDNFANGLALALRERWPAMYKDFRHYSQTVAPKTGELWTWAGVGGVWIVDTQEPAASHGANPGRATSCPLCERRLRLLFRVLRFHAWPLV